jgi:hypothetical protein
MCGGADWIEDGSEQSRSSAPDHASTLGTERAREPLQAEVSSRALHGILPGVPLS